MANVASPAKTVSTAAVKPQDRGFDSDRLREVVFQFLGTADLALQWSPARKVQVVGVVVTNGAVAMAASTNTTLVDVDSYDGANTKVADIASKLAATTLAAGARSSLTLSTTVADTVVENTETVFINSDITGTQGPHTVTIQYVDLEVTDLPTDWTA